MRHILTQLRERHGYTQEQLAEVLDVSRQHIAKVERNEAELKLSQARQCAELFDISVETLALGQLPEEDILPVLKKSPEKINCTEARDPRPQMTVDSEKIQLFKEVLLYILEKVGAKPNVGKTVLFKLLYFIDFDFYETYEEQLMGATYRKEAYGPLPKEFSRIVTQMKKDGELQEVQHSHFGKDQLKYLPLRTSDLSLLKGHELAMIDDVLRKHANKNATEIMEYSHRDIPWRAAKMHEAIEYEAVFYRDDEFSVRTYEDPL